VKKNSGFTLVPILVFLVLAAALVALIIKVQSPVADNSHADQQISLATLLPTMSPTATPTPSPSPSPIPSPTQTPSPIPTKSPTPKPTATPIPVTTGPAGSGFSVKRVHTDRGDFTVYVIGADLATTKVIVDTASGGDCANNCPVLPLKDYVTRNNAYAGVNGGYFCPDTYPSCAGKTNSFDTLLMNKDKVYFNSSNNVYSTNPAVIFQGGSIRFVREALEWGRDTSVDGVLSNYPLLVFNKSNQNPGSGDPKLTAKGNRSFVANRGNMVFIGTVLNASVQDSAAALTALEMDNAINLDSGGSTALWSGGYKLGPGRNLPDVILFKTK
jgi:hypothetical protein